MGRASIQKSKKYDPTIAGVGNIEVGA